MSFASPWPLGPIRRVLAHSGSSLALALVLGATTVMALACDVTPQGDTTRRGGAGGAGSSSSNGAGGGQGAGQRDAGSYDPQTPTNGGPTLNPAGYAAVLPILDRQCAECHHPGTWLDLTSGADTTTADRMLSAIKAGTMPPAPRAALSGEDLAKLQSWRDGQTPAAATSEPDPKGAPVTQIVAAQTLATYKAALPKVGWPRLAKLLASPSTLFWDKATLPPAYQDTVGDGSSLPFGARLNSEGKSLIVQEGKKLFSDDGTTWAYPFGHTAGADASPDIFIVDFMALPEVNGAQLPVAYEVESTTVSSLPVKRWNWSFPRGTVVGEIIMIKDGSSLLTTELRVRERFGDRWATNVFRPFPTAAVLAATVKAKRPQWQSTPALSSLVAALAKPTLTAKHKGSPAFSDLVVLDGSVDAPLPDFGDDALVRELLGTTTFVAAYGTVWKTDGTAKAFGPTGPTAGLSVVPSGFDTGLLEVRETTCEKCHNQGGYFIGDLVDQAILYGDIWGVDRIFSFHPFEPSRIDASGAENRSVRAPFAQIVQPYNPNKHPSSRYSFYRPMR